MADAWTYELDDVAVARSFPDGTRERAAWADLVRVMIVTTDEGPFVEDVYWMLEGPPGKGCLVPQGAPISDALLARLQQLPGFDNDAVIRAMQCTENARFLCWERKTATSP